MMQVLTKEEAHQSMVNELAWANLWWNDILDTDKVFLYDRYKELLKQLHCEHMFTTLPYYGELRQYCTKCNYNKPA